MKFRILALALCLLLAGCADQSGVTVIPAGDGEQEEPAPQEETVAPETEAPPEPEMTEEEAAFLENLAGGYIFCSGAGAWSTELTLLPDGSFTGLYHDSDMGDNDPEKYPGGTVYICQFAGCFARPKQVDGTTWTVEIEALELDHPADNTEEFADEFRYIYSEPYGLRGTETMTVYLPDTPVDGLPEGALWAARGPYDWQGTAEGTLGLTILYNAAQEQGFVQYPLPVGDA